MDIAFVTEMMLSGKIPRNFLDMRVPLSWICSLEADHIHYTLVPDKMYDVIIVILPKKNLEEWIKLDVLNKLKSFCKKLAIMQEGPHWYFQDYKVSTQFWFYNALTSTDILLVHNNSDAIYYEGLLNHPNIKIMPSLMLEDIIEVSNEERNGVMIGGNFCYWYGGFDSYIVAQEAGCSIYAPSMGRKQEEEEQIPDITHLPYINWKNWIYELSKRKYGIHLMRTQAAGTFALNCAYLGIPCIGYKGLDTQEICHPDLTIEVGFLSKAKILLNKLKDKSFYKECADKSKRLYKECYTEKNYKEWLSTILS